MYIMLGLHGDTATIDGFFISKTLITSSWTGLVAVAVKTNIRTELAPMILLLQFSKAHFEKFHPTSSQCVLHQPQQHANSLNRLVSLVNFTISFAIVKSQE